MLNFSSDNATGICPEILEAMAAANAGSVMAYGNDEGTARMERALQALFETDCAVFPMTTGTIANALALAALVPPYGVVFCHRHAHIQEDECGAPELFTGGAKLTVLDGEHAKFTAADLAEKIAGSGQGIEHHPQAAAVSITQASELGTVYGLDKVRAIAEVSHANGLTLHMDGARFANAVVTLGCSPAEATWKQGVDVMSFGATKNGAMAAEAVIFFDTDLVRDFRYLRKRGGQLYSKMRFLSAQLEAYVADGLWLKNAAHANAAARRLADGLLKLAGAELFSPLQANELFITLPAKVIDGLKADGVICHSWGSGNTIRLVTSFNTAEEAVDQVIAIAEDHAGAARAAE